MSKEIDQDEAESLLRKTWKKVTSVYESSHVDQYIWRFLRSIAGSMRSPRGMSFSLRSAMRES